MNETDYAALAEVIRRASDETALKSTDFEQDHRSPWTRNTRIHYRQSVIRATLRRHPALGVVDDEAAEGGRIKVVDPEGGAPLLLKPLVSLLGPSPTDPDTGVQQTLFGSPDGEPLLAYDLSEETITLYAGQYRQVRRNGRTEFQIVGEMHIVWMGTDGEPVTFDQEQDIDWTDHLDSRQGEAGKIS